MPTTLPRMAIVVTKDQHELLTRLGQLQGRPAASYVRHLVDLATPSLRAILRPLEAAIAAEELHDLAVSDALDAAQERLDDQLAMAFGDELDELDEAAHRREEGAASAGSAPRRVTTGVR